MVVKRRASSLENESILQSHDGGKFQHPEEEVIPHVKMVTFDLGDSEARLPSCESFPSLGKSVLKLSRSLESLVKFSTKGPQSTTSDDSVQKVRNTLVFTARKRKSTISLAMMAFCTIGFTFYFSSRSLLKTSLVEVADLMVNSKRLGSRLRTTQRDVRILQRELEALDQMEEEREDLETERQIRKQSAAFTKHSGVIDEMNTIQTKVQHSIEHIEELKLQVQETSRRDVIEKYGDGVHRVELELLFPPGSTVGGPTHIVLQMAPLDLMPHSVHTFLEMASNGLLDGCSFILNALHVLKMAPLPYDYSPATDKAEEFSSLGLTSVAFREYSPKFAHTKFTVGFAADGSPSFYINTDDNTGIHGGDPCFAKVVAGFETLERMENSPTRNGIWFAERIGIKSARVL